MLNNKSQLKDQTRSGKKQHNKKINLKDIEFEKNNSKKLPTVQKKKRRYYDCYSDDNDNKSAADNENEDSIINCT